MSEIEPGAAPEQIEPAELAPDVAEESSPSPEEPSAAPEAPKAKGVQKRLDELTAQRYRAEREADDWKKIAQEALSRTKAPEPSAPEVEKAPDINEYTDFAEYTRSQARYEAKQAVREEMRAEQARIEQQRQQYEAMTLREQFNSKVSAFAADAPDFDHVVRSINMSNETFAAAQQSEMGPALLYHLGKHPDLAEQIFHMTPYQQAMRLGRLEVELSQPKPRTLSRAPDPLNPLAGNDAVGYDPNKGTAEQYRAWRNEQLRKK